MTPRPTRRRALATVAVAALGLTLMSPAHAGGETESATRWLDGQLTDGLVINQQFDFTDVGLSIDVGLLALATGDGELAQRVEDAVLPEVGSYVGGGEVGGEGEVYASSVAKAARFVQLSGQDPRQVDGRDLVSDLEGLTDDTTGEIADQSESGNFAATIGQSFAAAALTTAGSGEADEALAFLLDQQCPAGGFRSGFGAEGSSCTDDAAANVDSTALAVQLLDPLLVAAPQLARAADYLEATQGRNGGFGAQDGVNSNTTGLAAYALALQGRDGAAALSADYVRGLQVRAPGLCTDTDEGAVAFDGAAFDTQKLDGVTGSTADQFVRATAQAGLALGSVTDPAPRSRIGVKVRQSYVRARTVEPVLISGLAPRDTACLRTAGTTSDEVAGADGTATMRTTTGPGTRNRTIRVVDTYGRRTDATLRVLGRRAFRVTAPDQRRRGAAMRVVATGLAAGEPASLYVARGDRRTKRANAEGRVVFRRVPVARPAGKRTYTVKGKFGDIRQGATTVRVLRPRS